MLTGGLHLYFYTLHIQNRFLEYDVNNMQTGNKFTFGDQVWDNMFWSLTSSLTIWTVYECGLLWLWSQGIIPKWSWDDGAIWFIALFILIPFWDSLHFMLFTGYYTGNGCTNMSILSTIATSMLGHGRVCQCTRLRVRSIFPSFSFT